MPIIKIHNVETGEIIEREMTPEEAQFLQEHQLSMQEGDLN
jgi:hypothetical protein